MSLRIPVSLHHPRFRLLWTGLLISVIGSQMQWAALLLHIYKITGQPVSLGGLGLVRIVPIIVFSLLGGALADVANRRRVMMITQSVLALQAVALAWLTLSGTITVWHIYALTAIQAMAVSFDLPARQALVPNLVPARDLPNAFSMTSVAFQTGAILGPALSGWAIAGFGLGGVYLLNAISFLAVLYALLAMGPVSQQVSPNRQAAISLHSIREGVQFILSRPIILSTMILDFVATFFSSANNLMPVMALDVLKVNEVAYGWLYSAQGLGAVLASLVVSQMSRIRNQGPVFLVSVMIFGLATVLFGMARSFFVALLAMALIGAADSVSAIIRNTIRQLQTPDYIRGRMVSINQIFFTGGPQLGEVEAGLVAQLFGAPIAIVSGGAACILVVAWISQRWPQLRRYTGEEAAMGGTPAD